MKTFKLQDTIKWVREYQDSHPVFADDIYIAGIDKSKEPVLTEELKEKICKLICSQRF